MGSDGDWDGQAHEIGTRVKPDTSTASPHVGMFDIIGRGERGETIREADKTDQTLDGGLRRAQRHMTHEEAEKYLDGNWRVRIVK